MENEVEIYETEESSVVDFTGKSRFIIVAKSVSAHCCFGYSVIDTKGGVEKYGDPWKKAMCETFYKNEAVTICRALNQYCK